MTKDDAQSYLDSLSKLSDDDIDLAKAAVALSARAYPERHLQRYLVHIEKLYACVAKRYKELLEAGAEDDLDTKIAALKHVIHDELGYDGDRESYDSLDNCNMLQVIDRRKGLPVAISILYIAAAQAQGWQAEGLNFPAHFMIRLSEGAERRILDPFDHVKVLGAPDLRGLVKKFLGENAELSADYYNPVSRRDVLVRLQNNLKLRLIEMEAYDDALSVVQQMRHVVPDEPRFFLDEGVLLARLDQRQAAIKALEAYLASGLSPQERFEIEAFLMELRTTLH